MTSRVHDQLYPFEVALAPGEGGLEAASVAFARSATHRRSPPADPPPRRPPAGYPFDPPGPPLVPGTCPAPDCLPGGGPARTDCFVETRVHGARITARRATCRDGDPACDADQSPGQCTLRTQTCFGVDDPALPSCTPSAVVAMRLTKPRLRSRNAAEADAARNLLAGMGGAVGRRGRVTLPRGGPGACTEVVEVVVPVARRGAGKLRAAMVASTATRGRKGRDPDRFVLACEP